MVTPRSSPRPSGGASLTVLEVEPVEVHAFHQVTKRFRFERGQAWVADLPAGQTAVRRGPFSILGSPGPPAPGDSRIGLEVAIVDGLNELLCGLYDLLLPGCRETRCHLSTPRGWPELGCAHSALILPRLSPCPAAADRLPPRAQWFHISKAKASNSSSFNRV